MTEQDRIDALERALQSGEAPSEEIASLMALVRMLEDLPEPQIDESFAAALEGRLSEAPVPAAAGAPAAAASTAGGSLSTIASMQARRTRRGRRGLVAAIAAAMMLALPVAASAAALPGTAGYGIRLAREEARLWQQCRAGAVRCGFAHLDRASLRLDDLRAVLSRGDHAQVRPTTRRLQSDLSTGARTILRAAPPPATLRRLARRLDDAAVRLNSLAAATPAGLRLPLREAMGEGQTLAQDVLFALGELPVIEPPAGTPPVAIGPPAPPPSNPPRADAPTRRETEPRKQPKGGNNFGPGGTPPLNKPAPGEDWSDDEPLHDDCPLGIVAAPGAVDVCAATSGSRP